VDADERRSGSIELTANERDVLIVVDIAAVSDHAEVAVASGQNGFGDAAHVAFVLHAVANEIRDREHLHIVFAAKIDELRHTRHGAVFIHDFADNARRIESGNAGQVDGGFGLTSTNENATVTSAQREHVARPGKILGPGLGVDGGEDGDSAIGSADAGGDAELGIDGFTKGGAMDGSVDGGHQREIEFIAALLGEREANETAAELGHKVDGVRGDFFGGQGEIAFVLAIFIVDEDDHASLTNFFYRFLYGAKRRGHLGHGIGL